MSKLRIERERALLTQDELAEKSGVSAVTIRAAERGERVAIRTRRALLHALKLPLERHEDVFGPVDLIPKDMPTGNEAA